MNLTNGIYEIEGFSAYRIDKDGIVTSIAYENYYMELKPRIDRGGYWSVRLSENGITHTKFIHRILAETFISKVAGKPFVNHKNGNKLDNRIENLEWVSHSENIKHAHKMGLIKPNCKHVIDNCTGKEYSSIKEAAKDLNINYGTFRNYLNGNVKNKTCLEFAT